MKPVPKAVLGTAATVPVVSVADLKNFIRVDNTSDDALIAALITAATVRLEEMTCLKFISQTWDVYFDDFEKKSTNLWFDGTRELPISAALESKGELRMPFGPVQSVGAFLTYDDNDTEYEFDPTQYQVDTVSTQGSINLKTGAIWPATILRPRNGIKVEDCVFGFGAAATNVPDPIKHAVMLVVAKLFENRGDSTSSENFGSAGFTIPNTAMVLLAPYMNVRL